MTQSDGSGTKVSRWEAWEDDDGTKHVALTLTPRDAVSMGPLRYGALLDALDTIASVFEPEDAP